MQERETTEFDPHTTNKKQKAFIKAKNIFRTTYEILCSILGCVTMRPSQFRCREGVLASPDAHMSARVQDHCVQLTSEACPEWIFDIHTACRPIQGEPGIA